MEDGEGLKRFWGAFNRIIFSRHQISSLFVLLYMGEATSLAKISLQLEDESKETSRDENPYINIESQFAKTSPSSTSSEWESQPNALGISSNAVQLLNYYTSISSNGIQLLNDYPSVSSNATNSAIFNSIYYNGGDFTCRYQKCKGRSRLGSSENFSNRLEEFYHLQRILTHRLSADAALEDWPLKEPRTGSGSGSLARQFWVSGCLSYHDKVQDGFLCIWGMNPYVWTMCNDLEEAMPSLESLLATDVSDSQMEVILIDKKDDSHLRQLEKKVLSLACSCTNIKTVAEQLGKLICMLMGGAASTEHGELLMRWKVNTKMLRDCLNSIVLPIGSLSVGLCKHRSLLFKCGDDREYLVDLIGQPGFICEPDSFFKESSLKIASPLHVPDFMLPRLAEEV